MKLIIKILHLQLAILLEYQNIKILLKKGYTRNWSEEVSVIKKVKNTVPWTYIISDLNEEKLVGTFYDKSKSKSKKRVKN